MLAANPFGLLCLPDSCLETEIIIHTAIIRILATSEREREKNYRVFSVANIVSGFYTDGLPS